MLKNDRPLKAIIGLNFATSLFACFFGCFWLFFAIGYIINGLIKGEWEGWKALFIGAGVLLGIWTISLIVTLIVCKRRIVLDGSNLRITRRKEIIYECPIRDILKVERGRFSPIINSNPGSIIIINFIRPLPDNEEFYVGWFTYIRIKRRIMRTKQRTI